jgi:hypothetical protein
MITLIGNEQYDYLTVTQNGTGLTVLHEEPISGWFSARGSFPRSGNWGYVSTPGHVTAMTSLMNPSSFMYPITYEVGVNWSYYVNPISAIGNSASVRTIPWKQISGFGITARFSSTSGLVSSKNIRLEVDDVYSSNNASFNKNGNLWIAQATYNQPAGLLDFYNGPAIAAYTPEGRWTYSEFNASGYFVC